MEARNSMRAISVLRLVTLLLFRAGALCIALLISACAGDDQLAQELRADARAIQEDKARMDIDIQNGSMTALMRDRHKLYVDTEKKEHDRGTEDDEFAEGEFSF